MRSLGAGVIVATSALAQGHVHPNISMTKWQDYSRVWESIVPWTYQYEAGGIYWK